jgi:Chromosome segregation ATPases
VQAEAGTRVMSTAVVDPGQTEDAFAALWLQVGYVMVGALSHRFDDRFKEVDQRLEAVERGQAVLTERVDVLTERVDVLTERVDVLTERVDGLTVRMDKVEQRLDKVEQRLDKVEQRLDKVEVRLENLEHGQTEIRDRLDRLENATMRGFERIEVALESLRGLVLSSERNAPPPPPVPRPRQKGR